MATLTIRNLDEEVKQRLRVRAARHHQSMEAEARDILKRAMASDQTASERGLGTRIHELFRGDAGVELELPERAAPRDVSDFSD